MIIGRLLRIGLPVGGLELVLVGGAAYFAWEHDQGKHAQAHLLCAVCWLDKIAPAPAQASAPTPTPAPAPAPEPPS